MSDGITEMMREHDQQEQLRQMGMKVGGQSQIIAAQELAKNALTKQEGGSHYKNMAIQPVEFITANDLGFLEGNVIKYICRHHAKNGAEDIKKAIHYCELLLQTKYGDKL